MSLVAGEGFALYATGSLATPRDLSLSLTGFVLNGDLDIAPELGVDSRFGIFIRLPSRPVCEQAGAAAGSGLVLVAA